MAAEVEEPHAGRNGQALAAGVPAFRPPGAEGDAALLRATRFVDYKDAFAACEDGVQRRVQLLFAVNGGVLAISNVAPGPWRNLFLSFMMVCFSIVLTQDIRAFGKRFNHDFPDLYSRSRQQVVTNTQIILCLAWLGLGLSGFSFER